MSALSIYDSAPCLRCPNEIWLRIVGLMAEEETMQKHEYERIRPLQPVRDLSTVCQWLRKLCVPRLFYRISIENKISANRLFDILGANTSLMHLVREMSVASRVTFEDISLFDKLCDLGRSVGPRLQSLTMLAPMHHLLEHTDAETRLAPLIASTKHLHISINYRSVKETDAAEWIISRASAVRSLECSLGSHGVNDSVEPDLAPLPDTLQQLIIHEGYVYKPRVYAALLQNLHHLRTLEVDGIDFAVSGTDTFLGSLEALAHGLTSLKLSRDEPMGSFVIDETFTAWNSGIIRLMQRCRTLLSLEVHHIFCEAATIAALPSTLRDVKLLYLLCREYAGEEDASAYEEFCSAVLRLPAMGVKTLDILHVYRVDFRNEEVQTELSKKMECAIFQCYP